MKAKTFSYNPKLAKPPYIDHMAFDGWALKITLRFEELDAPVYVNVAGIIGYRVLQEGDLINYWNSNTRPEGWIWLIENGGWFEQECQRKDFVSGIKPLPNLKEYFIVGSEFCVNILTLKTPEISSEEL